MFFKREKARIYSFSDVLAYLYSTDVWGRKNSGINVINTRR